MAFRVKYSAMCGHGDELYILYFCSKVGFDVVGADAEWALEENSEKRTEKTVIKDRRRWWVRFDVGEVKFYSESSLWFSIKVHKRCMLGTVDLKCNRRLFFFFVSTFTCFIHKFQMNFLPLNVSLVIQSHRWVSEAFWFLHLFRTEILQSKQSKLLPVHLLSLHVTVCLERHFFLHKNNESIHITVIVDIFQCVWDIMQRILFVTGTRTRGILDWQEKVHFHWLG